jgi:hypothetical protein
VPWSRDQRAWPALLGITHCEERHMGQRANLVIVSGGRAELFYSHWRANTLDVDLFWGPPYATAFVRAQQGGAEVRWLDDVWAEGGAVIDHDRRVLLFFGGEDVMYDVPRRRLHLALMARLWRGWDVRWAYGDIADIAAYVGVPKETVLAAEDDPEPTDLSPPAERGWVNVAVTVRRGDGSCRVYPSHDLIDDLARAGPGLLAAAAARDGERHVRWSDWTTTFPQAGLHADEPERTVEFWQADPGVECAARAARCWPGWTVRFHGDHYEWHAPRAGGALEYPTPDPAALANEIRDRLLRPAGRSGADLMLDLTARLRDEGKGEVTANPHALEDAQLDLSEATKIELLEAALADVGGRAGGWP